MFNSNNYLNKSIPQVNYYEMSTLSNAKENYLYLIQNRAQV